MSRVSVLKGGRSLERQVSLRTAARVEGALERLGHEVLPLDVGEDLVDALRTQRPDLCFVALHGRDGEDGTVQELLEVLGFPYTGSGVSACIRASDKVLAKHVLRDAGVATPPWHAFSETAFRDLGAGRALGEIEAGLGFPLVVKPASQGSALGIRFAAGPEHVPGALVAAFSYDRKVLLERFVAGRDLAVSLLDGEPLPAVEVRVHGGDPYDFEARYEIGRTEFVCPAEVAADAAGRAAELAVETWEALGLEGFARVDLMLDGATDELWVLEANPVPGLTETSLLPQAAEAAGLAFDAVVERVLESARRRHDHPDERIVVPEKDAGRSA